MKQNLIFTIWISFASATLVEIKQGTLRGVLKSARNGDLFTAFYGVPFAEPPIGDLRWEPPLKPSSWTGVKEAINHADECLQNRNEKVVENDGSEDCLYLNVFTKSPGDPKAKKQVLVWFHGGAFIFGGAKIYSPDYIMEEDVVLVIVQYRLNIFGFLSAEDEDLPGNYGALDQVQALRWVQENIEQFGGDPDSVTIFGMSAGGASVHYLMLSPLTKGLFKNAISLSGSALNWWANIPEPKSYAQRLARHFKCPLFENGKNIVECLKKFSGDDIMRAQRIFFEWQPDISGREPMNVFSPRSDPERKVPFLPEHPLLMMEKGNIHSVPYMLGYSEKEGIWRTNYILPDSAETGQHWTDFWTNFDSSVGKLAFGLFNQTSSASMVLEKMKEFYNLKDMDKRSKNEWQISEEKIANFVDAQSDTMFIFGIDETAKLHAKNAKSETFFYFLKYPTEHSIANFRIDHSVQRHPSQTMRLASHCTDMLMLFNMFPIFGPVPEKDRVVQKGFIQMILDFGKNNKVTQYPEWKSLKHENSNYLEIDKVMTVRQGLPYQERMDFWKQLNVYWKYLMSKDDVKKEEL